MNKRSTLQSKFVWLFGGCCEAVLVARFVSETFLAKGTSIKYVREVHFILMCNGLLRDRGCNGGYSAVYGLPAMLTSSFSSFLFCDEQVISNSRIELRFSHSSNRA
jgi:hypothetical protein